MGSQKLLRRQFAGGNSLRKQRAMVSFAHIKDPASNDYPVSQPQIHCGPVNGENAPNTLDATPSTKHGQKLL